MTSAKKPTAASAGGSERKERELRNMEASESNENLPALQQPQGPHDLYVALKLACELASMVSLSEWNLELKKFKSGEAMDDYQLVGVLKELLVCEAALPNAAKAISLAKQALQQHMASKVLKGIVEG